jgi:cell division protein FtsW (lipid II flippase)
MPILLLIFIALFAGGLMMFFAAQKASNTQQTFTFTLRSLAYFLFQLVILIIIVIRNFEEFAPP